MAKKQGIQDTSKTFTNSFSKGLNKDSDPSFVSAGMWTHAINVVNNTIEGDVNTLSNEISTQPCGTTGTSMPATATNKYIIGAIYLYSDKWVLFTAGHDSQGQRITSEIGLYEEDSCRYREIVQDPCLNFDKRYLISGSSREKEDCTWQVYWADGFNPDRFLNIGDPQTWPDSSYIWLGGVSMNYYSNGTVVNFLWPGVAWNEKVTPAQPCEFTTYINSLNCDAIRLARLMETPCLNLTLGQSGGTMANGTYFAVIAYSIKGQRVTDYFSQSNFQFVYTINDLEGSLLLEVEADSDNFDEFILVIVEATNQQTVATQMGFYSTKTSRIALDQINISNIKIPLEQLPIQTPVFETSDQITEVNEYLLRVGPRSRFDFNYQPLANMIRTRWASVEYPGDYYMKGGNKTNYLRDEVYTFYIRWVYNTGDKSASYHIPGRAPRNFSIPGGPTLLETSNFLLNPDKNILATDDLVFEVYNTATIASTNPASNPLIGTTTDDGGTIIATGEMGYWESTEIYPDNRPDIWNSSSYCWTGPNAQLLPGQLTGAFDLCGEHIRHHKFPENFINNSPATQALHFRPNTNTTAQGSDEYNIRLMGVYFENITLPKDQNGIDIPGVVGYEILRGSREGNKTIIAKGMVNNFRSYQLRNNIPQNTIGLYPNYPYNAIIPTGNTTNPSDHNYQYNDPYIRNQDEFGNDLDQNIPTDIFTFHSPDTMFRTPFLSTTEFKLYGTLSGYANLNFQEPNGHPNFKLLSDDVILPMIVAGVAEAIISMLGKRTINEPIINSYTEQLRGTGGTGAINLSYGPTGSGTFAGGNSTPGTGGQIEESNIQTGGLNSIATDLGAYNNFMLAYYNVDAWLDIGTLLTGGYQNTQYAQEMDNLISTINNNADDVGIPGLLALAGSVEFPKWGYLDPITRSLGALNQVVYYFSEGADVTLKIFYALAPYRQYALQSLSHGYYSNMTKISNTELLRFRIRDSFYLRDNIQNVSKYQDNIFPAISYGYKINNLKRSDAVTVRTTSGPDYIPGVPDGANIGPHLITSGVTDKSLVTLGTLLQSQPLANQSTFKPNFNEDDKDVGFRQTIASHYGGLKARVRNQYGQLGSEFQIVITPCEQKLKDYSLISTQWQCPTDFIQYFFKTIPRTPILFGGDTYINRYTEKNNMMFFYDWLYDQPDGFEYNYYLHGMIPQPRFKVNSQLYDVNNLAEVFTPGSPAIPGIGARPSASYRLDFWRDCPAVGTAYYNYTNDLRNGCFQLVAFPPFIWYQYYAGFWAVKNAYFYLANSGIRDFFVESEVLNDFRQQSINIGGKHYDPYGYNDYQEMFNMNPSIMGRLSEYIYDYSLSVSKLYNQYFSAGTIQSIYYDPEVAKLCYTYYPDRIIYSLPQQYEAVKDSWFIYLVNNYKEFKSQISGVKAINKSGIFITFKNDSPLMYQGVDTLQTDLGTKITIGDGGLFSQPQQSVSNSDKAYEYGSSQNRRSVISTPAGLYFMSQNQGRIFAYGEGLKEISQNGMKWWYILYMPYKLTEDFPDYPWQDNPVSGIGCHSTYDSSSTILYFAKKDYGLKAEFKGLVVYVPLNLKGKGDYFTVIGQPNIRYLLGDPRIFDDASWTISYDPKAQYWISFHDWHPDLLLPTKDIFLSIKNNTLWKHNYLCDTFCNFYGNQHGFELEFPIVTGQTVMTTRSMEYALECYRRNEESCIDQHHVLDYNFDQAIVYNTEQVSGYLNLNLYPKNDINLSLEYPKLGTNQASYDILFSKEEQKYRFNQFWDITKNRDEFPIGSNYPPTGVLVPGTTILQGNYSSQNTWITSIDGYNRILNPNNMDYGKPELQRKKFRHYLNFLSLRKEQCDNVNMILKLSNSKNQYSLR